MDDLYEYKPMNFSDEDYSTIIKEIRKITYHHFELNSNDEIPSMAKKEISNLKRYIQQKIINLPKQWDFHLRAALLTNYQWGKLLSLEKRGMVLYANLTRKIVELKEEEARIHFLNKLNEDDTPPTPHRVAQVLEEVNGTVSKMNDLEIENRELRKQNVDLRFTIRKLECKQQNYTTQLRKAKLKEFQLERRIAVMEVFKEKSKQLFIELEKECTKAKDDYKRELNLLNTSNEKNNVLELTMTEKQSDYTNELGKLQELQKKRKMTETSGEPAQKKKHATKGTPLSNDESIWYPEPDSPLF